MQRRLPLWLKLAFTAFMAVLVPVYWQWYGPTNFLYFCDVALFFTLAALWLESPLLASAPLIGIFLPQMLWVVDFLAVAVGIPLTDLTNYMFDSESSLLTRGLSFFHFWLPFLLLGMVWRLGYDRRALVVWTLLSWGLMLIGYFALPGPMPKEQRAFPGQPVNVNYVYGFSEDAAQTWMSPGAYFALVLIALPILVFVPSHLLALKLLPRAKS